MAPQADVEQYFITNGYLFPEFNQHYWMGLNASVGAGPWNWISPDVPSSQIGSYRHWATGLPAAGASTCGVGNWNTTYGGAWGWMNTGCGQQHVSICRINRERPALLLCADPVLRCSKCSPKASPASWAFAPASRLVAQPLVRWEQLDCQAP
jgi:hypothetical protein